jgi:hypothetical protein
VLPKIEHHDQLLLYEAKGARHALAELLHLLDLSGKVIGEGVLKGLDRSREISFVKLTFVAAAV